MRSIIHENSFRLSIIVVDIFFRYLDNNKISVIHPRAFEKLPKLQAMLVFYRNSNLALL